MTTITKARALRSDLEMFDGVSITATRRDSTGGTTTGLAVGNEVDVLQVYGGGTDRTEKTLQRVLTAIPSANRTLVFAPGTWTIATSVTLPSNLACRVPAGTVFDIASGVTLTLAGPVYSDMDSISSGAGTLAVTGTAGLNASQTLISYDAGAAVAPSLTLSRRSPTAADADDQGVIVWQGRNDADQDVSYARLLASAVDVSDGTEDGSLTVETIIAGTLAARWIYGNGFYSSGVTDPGAGAINCAGYQLNGNPVPGALVYRNSNQSIADVTATAVQFDNEARDTDSLHDNATNNTRLTVPAGYSFARLTAVVAFAQNATGDREAEIYRSGVQVANTTVRDRRAATAAGATHVSISSPLLAVSEGDYFEVFAYQSSTGALNVQSGTCFGIELFA